MFDEDKGDLQVKESAALLSSRGYKKDLLSAVGFDVNKSMASGEAIVLNSECEDFRERDLVMSWGGEVTKFTGGENNGKYFLQKVIDSKRSVAVLVEFNEERTKSREKQQIFAKIRRSSFKVSEVVVRNIKTDKCVGLSEWIPEGVDVSIHVNEGRTFNKKRQTKKSFTPNEDSSGGEIVFEQLDSLDDVLGLVHEAEHANLIAKADTEIRKKLNDSRQLQVEGGVAMEVNDVKKIKSLEEECGMSVEEAFGIVANNEHDADKLADIFADETSAVLYISQEDMDKYVAQRETFHQSYDKSSFGGQLVTLLIPDGCVSDRAKNIQAGKADALHEHFSLTRKLIELWEDKNFDGWVSVDTPEGQYRFFYNRSYLHVITPASADGNSGQSKYFISLTSCFKERDADGEPFNMKLNNFEEAEESVKNVDVFVSFEKKILDILSEVTN